MSVNARCPKCGSTKVQMSQEKSKHGCLWTLLFGWWYVFFVMIKWCIGFMVLVCFDWWMAIIKNVSKKGYVWKSKGYFSGVKRTFYCHDCGYNFKG